MAEYNVIINKKSGNTNDKLYPTTKAGNVKITYTTNLPSGVSNTEQLANALGDMAFDDGDSLLYIGEESSTGASAAEYSEVNDDTVSTTSTWSSSKLKALFESLGVKF